MSILGKINKKISDSTSINNIESKKDEILELVEQGYRLYKIASTKIFEKIESNSGSHLSITNNYILLNYQEPKLSSDAQGIIDRTMDQLANILVKNNIMDVKEPIEITIDTKGNVVLISTGQNTITGQGMGSVGNLTIDNLITLAMNIEEKDSVKIEERDAVVVITIA